MKIKTFTPLIAFSLLFITCTKENSTGSTSRVTARSEDNSTLPPDIVPLNDLGPGLFRGYTGGLYPGGANSPSGQYATDLFNISGTIIPIDTNGVASPASGKIAFISLGASIGGKNMKALIPRTKGNPATNPKLLLMNGNEGGKFSSLSQIANPLDPYWYHVNEVTTRNKSSFRQIQVVYLETDDGIKTRKFPDRPNQVKAKILSCARTIKQKFPNAKVIYLLARTRTFNDTSNNATPWNTEPAPYFFGWACKWAIEDQINGVPGTAYKGSGTVAPLMTWGFYQWADSLPRITDDFYWRFSETKDGLHSNDAGEDTLATRFQNFLLTDPNSKKWYAAP